MKILIYAFLIFFCAQSMGYETIAKLSFKDNIIEVGENKKATLEVYPITKMIFEDLKTLENNNFIDYFKVSKVSSLEQSPNNPEVWTISLELVLLKEVDVYSPHIWNWKAMNIPIEMSRELRVLNKVKNENQVVILNSDLVSKKSVQWPIIAVVILLIILSVLYLEIKKRKERKLLSLKWKDLFNEVSRREDFEKLYEKREIWLGKFPANTPCVDQFFEVINKCQYKKEWSDIELDQVRNAFDELKMAVEKI